MKKYLLYLLLFLGHIAVNAQGIEWIDGDKKNSSLKQVEFRDCDSLKTSVDDTILLQEFLVASKSQLEKDFMKLFDWVDGFNTLDFSIENVSIWKLQNRKIALLKILGVGDSSAKACANYILDLNDAKINVIDTTCFFAPDECGACDYTNIRLSSLDFNGEFVPVVIKQSELFACCGASDELKLEWILFSSDFSKRKLVIEQFYENKNNDSCGNDEKPFSRKTEVLHDKNNFVLVITHYENNVPQYTAIKTIKY